MPYVIHKNNAQFVKITPGQYKELMKEYKGNDPLSTLKYHIILAKI